MSAHPDELMVSLALTMRDLFAHPKYDDMVFIDVQRILMQADDALGSVLFSLNNKDPQ